MCCLQHNSNYSTLVRLNPGYRLACTAVMSPSIGWEEACEILLSCPEARTSRDVEELTQWLIAREQLFADLDNGEQYLLLCCDKDGAMHPLSFSS